MITHKTKSQTSTVHRLTMASMFAAVLFLSSLSAQAQSLKLVAIEEDWIALVRNADAGRVSPQIVNVIAPSNTISSAYGIVELNHSTEPLFAEGGLQLQVRQGDLLVGQTTAGTGSKLSFNLDRVEYTVAVRVASSGTTLEVSNIRSKSWRSLRQKTYKTTLGDKNVSLSDYTPDFSVANSGVNVGSQRVAKMAITSVRYIYSDGSIRTDSTERVVGQYADSTEPINATDYASE